MAKGLGAILAAIDLERRQEALASLAAPACPVCGEPMEADGTGWFCYSNERMNQCLGIAALEVHFFTRPPDDLGFDFQGQTVAGIVTGDQRGEQFVVARLATVRGPRGKTNLRIWADGCLDEEVPELAAKFGWTWMEWAEGLKKF